MRRSSLPAVFALACAGCAAVLGIEDLVDDAPTTDAGAEGAASAVDDGGDADAAVPLRFCERQDATFCADFDEPNDAGLARFTSTSTGDGGYYLGASDASAPNAFVATTRGDKASGYAPAGTFRRRAQIAASLRVDVAPTNGNLNLIDIGGTTFFLHVSASGNAVVASPWYSRSRDDQHEISAACVVTIPTTTWSRIELGVETPDTITFRTDGVERCRIDVSTDAGILPNVAAKVDLGFGFTQDAGTALVDDVTVSVE